MKPDKKNADSDKMFDSLARNAIAFLERSVDELKDTPNYAVIDFCTAIELFLKARLLLEHWALIFEDINEANKDKFREGKFKSVGIKNAVARLRNISGQGITETQERVFEKIRDHRNRIVHFFHQAYGPNPDPAAVGEVTAEQCQGWFYLYPLLSRTWQSHFASYAADLKRIDRKMHENRSFLKVKYEARLKDIERGKATGVVFESCWFCDFEAMRKSFIAGPLLSIYCLVCENSAQGIELQCPACGVSPSGLIGHVCWKCSRPIILEEVLDTFASSSQQDNFAAEDKRALCSNYDCLQSFQEEGYRQSVILFDNKWVCLLCFAVGEDAWNCADCGRRIAGEFSGPFCLECDLQDDHAPMFGGIV